jgi:prolyl oligopeptidase
MPVTSPLHAPVEEMIHGVLVRDPYRWLEDRSLPETEEWIREQQRRCDAYFSECKELPVIRERVREYLDVEVVDQPTRVGDRYFYRRRDRGEEQANIYVRDVLCGVERQLVSSSPLGSFASVGIHRISDDGSLLAYEVKDGGTDQRAIHVIEVESGRILPNSVATGYTRGFCFTPDCQGFYYCHEMKEPSDDHTIRFRGFGVEDEKVCFRVARSRESRLILTADSVHLGAIYIHNVDGVETIDFWIAACNQPDNWHSVFRNRQLPFSPILKYGRIFALSYEQAPNGKLVELDRAGDEIRIVVPQQEAMVRQLVITGNRVFINCLVELTPSIRSWSLAGANLGQFDIPTDGTIQLLPAQSELADSVFYTYESFTQPLAILEYGVSLARTLLWPRREVPTGLPDCCVRKTAYFSNDGAAIPITLVSHGQTNMEKACPAIMTSYGGFGMAMTPRFSVLVAIMMELGAVFALPHIRGGGEFDKEWHDAARGRNRQVAFDDFIAAAEWLRSEEVALPEQLGIFGGSNSGLLVGVAMTQRPNLFRAVLCIAPLLDMVRYELFDQAARWRQEYGSIDDPEDFIALHAYSPYHHIAENMCYPSVFFVSGDNDERCNPSHVRKMAHRLQNGCTQNRPVVVDYSKERGHSPVLPLSVRVDALARRVAFLCRELDIIVAFGGIHEAICT